LIGRPVSLGGGRILNGSSTQWTAVSGGTDLPPGAARAVIVDGLDIVIWRGQSGGVQAWQNRCPHRGMRLSFSQVRGDNLVCRYHGWSFDQAGQCRGIPASPEMTPPETACVPAYACREALDLIWVHTTSDDETAALDDLAQRAGLGDSALFIKTIYVDGAAAALGDQIGGAPLMPGVVQLPDQNVIVVLQQSGADRCALHVIAPANGDTTEQRLHQGDWAKRLRHSLSTQREAAS